MQKVDEIWAEEDIIKRFYLPKKETDKGVSSRKLGYWISKGLKCIELSDKRYFREEDIVAFFNKLAENSEGVE